MKPLYKKIILWALLVLHISLIFSFSFQSAAESSVLSQGLTGKIKSEEKFAEQLRSEKDAEGGEKYKNERVISVVAGHKFDRFEGIIRKLAHVSLFFVLDIILIFLLISYGIQRLLAAGVSILFATAIGFTDETIQLFSLGRAGMLTDVFVDLLGAVIASILFVAGGKIYEKIKEKRFEMDS